MKIKLVIAGIVACATLAAVSGCKKQEAAPPSEAPKPSEGMASEAAKAVDATTSAATQAIEQATAQVKAVEQQVQTNAVEQQAQGLIERAKSLVTEQKYQDALSSLSQLTNIKLTAEQQKLVDDLKAQIQSALAKAAATDPASAMGGALGGKK